MKKYTVDIAKIDRELLERAYRQIKSKQKEKELKKFETNKSSDESFEKRQIQ